jgi:hypothetical protein
LLLQSARVFEDLEYALRGPPDSAAESGSTFKREWDMSLVARAWDPRLKPSSEFRGICWNNKLTCLAQYYHPLYFEELQGGLKDTIQADIFESFENARGAVAQLGGNCIIDFAWLGQVITPPSLHDQAMFLPLTLNISHYQM